MPRSRRLEHHRLRRRTRLASIPVGGVAPAPVQIEHCWIQSPLIRKPTVAITRAQISQSEGVTAYATADAATVRRFGDNAATATLYTACDADPFNLAEHLVEYQSTPRPRQPTMTFALHGLEVDEVQVILGVDLGQRVVVLNTPAGTPPGAKSFVVEGIRHSFGVAERWVTWQTSAPIGTVAGTPGPWFRWDSSSWDGTDLRPF